MYGPLGRQLQISLRVLGFDVLRAAKPTSGLARPDYYDWSMEAQELLDDFEPHVVLVMFGGNDGQVLKPMACGVPEIRWPDQQRWRPEYEARVRGLLRQLRGAKRQVFLLSPTNRRPRQAAAKMKRIRQVQRQAAQGLEDVVFVDMWPFSSDHHGRFLERGVDGAGRDVPYRRTDGIHLTDAGATVVGRRLIETLRQHGLMTCR